MHQVSVCKPEVMTGEEYTISPEYKNLENMYKTGQLTKHEQPGILRMK